MANVGSAGYTSAIVSSFAPTITIEELKASDADALVIVTNGSPLPDSLKAAQAAIDSAATADKQVGKSVVLLVDDSAPNKRLIVSPTGALNRFIDDARRVGEAATKGIQRAVQAGALKPALFIHPELATQFPRAIEVGTLGALVPFYSLLQARDFKTPETYGLNVIGGTGIETVAALESGRVSARDLIGGDPEYLAPPAAVEYIKKALEGSNIEIEVIDSASVLQKEYPLLWAVARGSSLAPTHHARVVNLKYVGEGDATKTFFLVGKGICFDTGGLDVKTGGAMKGMNRDKGGAAAVLGVFRALDKLRPKGITVHGKLALVRNDISAYAYTCDENITSRAGVRCHIGNTDAEGRMVMTDLIAHSKEQALNSPNPHIVTIATLTGHALRVVGKGYSIALDNGPAKKKKFAQLLQDKGDLWADPFEVTTLRREDFDFVAATAGDHDVVQANNLPSTMTNRGHQFPMAFMIIASGLNKHDIESEAPIAYTHLDIAGSAGLGADMPTGAPTVTLAAAIIDL